MYKAGEAKDQRERSRRGAHAEGDAVAKGVAQKEALTNFV